MNTDVNRRVTHKSMENGVRAPIPGAGRDWDASLACRGSLDGARRAWGQRPPWARWSSSSVPGSRCETRLCPVFLREPTGLRVESSWDVLGGAQRRLAGELLAAEGGANAALRAGDCLGVLWGGLGGGRGNAPIEASRFMPSLQTLRKGFKGLFNEGKPKCSQK